MGLDTFLQWFYQRPVRSIAGHPTGDAVRAVRDTRRTVFSRSSPESADPEANRTAVCPRECVTRAVP